MSKLNTKERGALKDSDFALPGRKYVIVDKDHAIAAIERATQGLKKGWVTQKEHDIIIKKAKAVLGEN
jgi:hypothetical protein